MAASQNTTAHSRFHNLSDAALADEIGRVDSISKAAEAELKVLKDEFKARRLDTKAVREFLGPTSARFEVPVISTVIRIRAANRVLAVAA
jgi:hypothetical protein